MNQQPLNAPLVCLGDGHDGIWNIYREIATAEGRREILDWYHLVENLGKVGGSQRRLNKVEARLWKGDVDGAIALFKHWQNERVTRFVGYLNHHRSRIINYDYWQSEGISIGSGVIESAVKQIGLRIKITGGAVERRECAAGAEASLCLPQWRFLILSLARLGCTRR
ncbi:MAG: hypothetical protein DCF25_14930 [Leptolyngbya foveolarum]|uniref:Transposase IS204/IS1001/IS1096/IS1165 DDE domain-containing protein n=1 Tax=Leptolyngbya foveolarum TaxID=47253 RepID=A0A2W4W5Q1_9CYAN|nr:MAG: hypothetical protein DCF25_14930 [Leptolyngbya foveolarum]